MTNTYGFALKSIAVVLGTRPEIIKLAHIIRLLDDAALVIHTGQHYDPKLSGSFFPEMGLPEPDVFLARVREDEYISAHPRPSDVSLLIEVADTSIGFDRERKTPRYARAGIPEVWIVELDEDVVEVCRGPVADEYTERLRLVRGQDVSPEAFAEVSLAIEEILGAP